MGRGEAIREDTWNDSNVCSQKEKATKVFTPTRGLTREERAKTNELQPGACAAGRPSQLGRAPGPIRQLGHGLYTLGGGAKREEIRGGGGGSLRGGSSNPCFYPTKRPGAGTLRLLVYIQDEGTSPPAPSPEPLQTSRYGRTRRPC